jgi:3-isopropylmalate/(R)-2-methylmalate dehydratase small subunit
MAVKPFIRLTGLGVPLPGANIDTDVIMPKAFLKGIDRSGLARGLFHDLRFDSAGTPKADFILNWPQAAGAQVLVVGPNFGCGSSREHAIWGLMQFGIRAVVGTSFAGIFADNAANNGLLLISLSNYSIDALFAYMAGQPRRIEIDLERQNIGADDLVFDFQIDSRTKNVLMQGLDRIGETLSSASLIREFEQRYHAQHPWLIEEGER